jgi:arylsulfatase A-like enzyme
MASCEAEPVTHGIVTPTLVLTALALTNSRGAAYADASADTAGHHPNILFIVMDDVGIDQMEIFGYGGATPPRTPNIDAIAHAGVRFRNVWSMPECSPSRAMFFEGRFPLRTNIRFAILANDLANSQLSPFEATTPKLLHQVDYESGLFGKFHLTSPTFNPFGNGSPRVLGWDFFDGFLEGAPHPIDTTAGGVSGTNGTGPYTCGFVPEAGFPNGANTGACYRANNACTMLSKDANHPTPGRSCLEQGGIFVPNQVCQAAPPSNLNFGLENGYYVWNRVLNQPDGTIDQVALSDPRSRGYVSLATTDAAVQWINSRSGRWMATVAYANAHTPYQQPPVSLLPADSIPASGFNCTGNDRAGIASMRVLSNQMIEAMDEEIGRVLVNTGLARRSADGHIDYHPEQTDTMVIIIGDNGTFAPGVKLPFDLNRAKGTVYQTGVWVPLVISGPLVTAPDREVRAMVNVADLFELFGEIAGVSVEDAVPKSRLIDSKPMLSYLTNSNQASIRQTNFTQTGNNIHLNDQPNPPCVLQLTSTPTCVQIFNSQGVCAIEGGTWYGPGAQKQYASCCAVKNGDVYPSGLSLQDDAQSATRNDRFKLVRRQVPDCSAPQPKPDQTVTEFYAINEDVPNPQIDKDGDSLCSSTGCPNGLSPEQLQNFNALSAALANVENSEVPCPGDGNDDKEVNGKDILDWQVFAFQSNPLSPGFSSSWYDFNHDGQTDSADLATILQNLGKTCGQTR